MQLHNNFYCCTKIYGAIISLCNLYMRVWAAPPYDLPNSSRERIFSRRKPIPTLDFTLSAKAHAQFGSDSERPLVEDPHCTTSRFVPIGEC